MSPFLISCGALVVKRRSAGDGRDGFDKETDSVCEHVLDDGVTDDGLLALLRCKLSAESTRFWMG